MGRRALLRIHLVLPVLQEICFTAEHNVNTDIKKKKSHSEPVLAAFHWNKTPNTSDLKVGFTLAVVSEVHVVSESMVSCSRWEWCSRRARWRAPGLLLADRRGRGVRSRDQHAFQNGAQRPAASDISPPLMGTSGDTSDLSCAAH